MKQTTGHSPFTPSFIRRTLARLYDAYANACEWNTRKNTWARYSKARAAFANAASSTAL